MHILVGGKLLRMDKQYKHLKARQKEKIAEWMYKAYKNQIENNISDDETLRFVYAKIEEAEIWIPYQEVKKRYCSKKTQFRKRLAREVERNAL